MPIDRPDLSIRAFDGARALQSAQIIVSLTAEYASRLQAVEQFTLAALVGIVLRRDCSVVITRQMDTFGFESQYFDKGLGKVLNGLEKRVVSGLQQAASVVDEYPTQAAKGDACFYRDLRPTETPPATFVWSPTRHTIHFSL